MRWQAYFTTVQHLAQYSIHNPNLELLRQGTSVTKSVKMMERHIRSLLKNSRRALALLWCRAL